MQDCTYFLYDSCKAKYPYVITEPSISRAADRLNTVLARLNAYPKEYREDVLELRDTLDILAYEQAHHPSSWGWIWVFQRPGRSKNFRAAPTPSAPR